MGAEEDNFRTTAVNPAVNPVVSPAVNLATTPG